MILKLTITIYSAKNLTISWVAKKIHDLNNVTVEILAFS